MMADDLAWSNAVEVTRGVYPTLNRSVLKRETFRKTSNQQKEDARVLPHQTTAEEDENGIPMNQLKSIMLLHALYL